jgi:hypothetical protein
MAAAKAPAKDPHDVQLAFIHMLRANILAIPRDEFVRRALIKQADVYPLLSPGNVSILGRDPNKPEHMHITPYRSAKYTSLNTKHNKTLNMKPFIKSSLRLGLGNAPTFCQTSVEYYEYYNEHVQFDNVYERRFNIIFYESLYVEMQRIEMELVKHVSNVTIYLADFYAEALLGRFAIVDKQTETEKKMEIDKKDAEGEPIDQEERRGTRNRINSRPIVPKFTEALDKAKDRYIPYKWDIIHDIPDIPPSRSKYIGALPDDQLELFPDELFMHGGHQQPEPYPLAGPAGPAVPMPVQTIAEEDLAGLINYLDYQDVDTLIDDYVPLLEEDPDSEGSTAEQLAELEEDPDSEGFTAEQLAELEEIIAKSKGE